MTQIVHQRVNCSKIVTQKLKMIDDQLSSADELELPTALTTKIEVDDDFVVQPHDGASEGMVALDFVVNDTPISPA